MTLTYTPSTTAVDDTNFYLASHYFNKPSQLYAYAFWVSILLLVLATKVPRPRRWWHLTSPLYRWALLKRPASTRMAKLSHTPDFLPSNGNIVLIVSFFILLCCLCFLGPDYIPGQGFKAHVPTVERVILKSLWTSAARAGLIAFCLLPMTVLLGLKASPSALFSWRLTIRLYFDKLAVFHMWSARFLYFFTALHVILWTTKLSMDTVDGEIALRKAFRKERFVCGWVAFGIFTILMASSSTALRRAHYDAFYALHVFLFPLMLTMSALHHPETGWWAWAALILWIVERIWRCGRIWRLNCWKLSPAVKADSELGIYSPATEKKSLIASREYMPPPGFAHAELLSGATIRLTYTPTQAVRWSPGQHFLLNIPVISNLGSHPFTCSTIPSKLDSFAAQPAMVFIIRTKHGWTKRLWDAVVFHTAHRKKYVDDDKLRPPGSALPSSGLVLRMFINGPFGSSVRVPWQDHSSTLIVAGGSGVTFGLSVLAHLCCVLAAAGRIGDAEQGTLSKLRRVRFVWLVREFGHIQWCASTLRQCKSMLSNPQLRIDIFITKTSIPESIDEETPKPSSNPAEMTDPPLLPPLPAFFHSFGRNSSLPSSFGRRNGSVELSSDKGRQVGLGYHVPAHASCESRDLTDFEGDSGTVLPGELSRPSSPQQSTIKRAGRANPTRRIAICPTESWEHVARVPSPLSDGQKSYFKLL